ncbi:murein L,D-transpeptidase catalytic domain-containing protein [Erythrobacter sp. HKB08]|uniref:murein L,D-transpeptidase catalytic domain-containing protein n=1 Tax=Erythrobacter sp. HKB08 TaxID=2502843 RepID=UPI001008A002|nr:murein L,D-transpeptidase catalytic domain family protein [Erythrobacter sp. HKB08]
MNRRELLTTSLAAGVAATLPVRLAAQVRTGTARDAILADIAKREQQRAGDLLWRRDVVGIADFGLRSSEPRFHFVDLERGVVDSYLVSHGDGSDPEHDGWLNWYSNEHNSHCTSKGLYMTYGWYTGRYGTSIRLEGLDPTNSNALDRAIVMHRAQYAEPEHVEKWGRLGRSNGCFAMGDADFKLALLKLGGGRVLFADSLGLAADGTRVERPSQEAGEIRLVRNEPPRGEEILTPGVY